MTSRQTDEELLPLPESLRDTLWKMVFGQPLPPDSPWPYLITNQDIDHLCRMINGWSGLPAEGTSWSLLGLGNPCCDVFFSLKVGLPMEEGEAVLLYLEEGVLPLTVSPNRKTFAKLPPASNETSFRYGLSRHIEPSLLSFTKKIAKSNKNAISAGLGWEVVVASARKKIDERLEKKEKGKKSHVLVAEILYVEGKNTTEDGAIFLSIPEIGTKGRYLASPGLVMTAAARLFQKVTVVIRGRRIEKIGG